MQRIWITGSSGSGKTTIANIVGEKLDIPIYNSDKIFWQEDWQRRPRDEQIQITKTISNKEKWIYEGNRFDDCKSDGRLENCDTIIYLNINRFTCVYRFIKRYFKYKGTVRPDISDGCTEKIDFDVIKYILIDFHSKNASRKRLFDEAKYIGKDVIILNGINRIQKWIKVF